MRALAALDSMQFHYIKFALHGMATLNLSALFRIEEKHIQKDSSAWWHIKQADLHAKCSPAAMRGVYSLPVVAEKQGIRETVS